MPAGDGTMIIVMPLGDKGLGAWDSMGQPLPGFPLRDGNGAVHRPALATDGGNPLIAWVDNGGDLHLTNLNGDERPGWPVSLGARPVTGVSALDLDSDGNRELALGTSDNAVHLLDLQGNHLPEWPKTLSSKLLWQPVQIALGGEAGRGMVLSLADARLMILAMDGRTLPGWPVQVNSPAGTVPVTADIDSDGLTDVIFATQNRRLYAVDSHGRTVDGWPLLLDDRAVRGASALGVTSRNMSQPQAAVSTMDSLVYLVNGDCSLAGSWRWPNRPGALATQPIIAAASGGIMVLVGCDDGSVHAWNACGEGVAGFPFSHGQRIIHSPAAGDIDGDGSTDLAVVGVGGLLAAYSLGSGGFSAAWPQPLSDAHNTGSYGISFLPVARVEPVEGEQSQEVPVDFAIQRGSGGELAVAYSTDAGYTWTPTGSWMRTPQGITWLSTEDLPAGDYSETRIQVTPFSELGPGVAGMTSIFRLDNNLPPVIYLSTPRRLQYGGYRIAYAVEDAEGDTIQLQAQYSLDDGASWQNARLSGSTLEIEPWMYGEPVVWDATADLADAAPEDISFRMRAADSDPGPWQVIPSLAASVARQPSGQILSPSGEVSDRVTLGVRLSSPDGSPLEMSYEYSVDGGASWQPATVTEPEEGAPSSFEFEILWHSQRDLPGEDHPSTMFRAAPDEADRSVAVPSAPFAVDNNRPPELEVLSPGSWDRFQGVVPVRFIAEDSEGDSLWAGLEYRSAQGGSWQIARGIEISGPFFSGQGSSVLRWNSSADFPAVESEELEIRLLVADRDTVRSEARGPILLDNRRLPSFMQAGVTDRSSGARRMEVSFELSDPRGRTLGIEAAYSADGGRTWRRADVTGDIHGLRQGDYAGRLTWSYRPEIFESAGGVLLRLTPTFEDTAGIPRILPITPDTRRP